MHKYSPSKERKEWKVDDDHFDTCTNDTSYSSLPRTHIINLQAMIGQCFFFFF